MEQNRRKGMAVLRPFSDIDALIKERLAGDRFREITGFIAYFWLA